MCAFEPCSYYTESIKHTGSLFLEAKRERVGTHSLSLLQSNELCLDPCLVRSEERKAGYKQRVTSPVWPRLGRGPVFGSTCSQRLSSDFSHCPDSLASTSGSVLRHSHVRDPRPHPCWFRERERERVKPTCMCTHTFVTLYSRTVY